MPQFHLLPCLDSDERAAANRRALKIPRDLAAELGYSAIEIATTGIYHTRSGAMVNFSKSVAAAKAAKLSIPPEYPLPPETPDPLFPETRIQVTNETTLAAARRLVGRKLRPLVLNFANGVHPGGGFLYGARDQEESICRSSALYLTLFSDPMYTHHSGFDHELSSNWCILSPLVPVFRLENGTPLDSPWLLDVITCAAPVCDFPPAVIDDLLGSPSPDLAYTARALHAASEAADALRSRIHRVLAIAKANRYETLILGAWGCGAFGNDPKRTATDFRHALETDFRGAFSEVVFAIADWSPEREFLGPFRDSFASPSASSHWANDHQ